MHVLTLTPFYPTASNDVRGCFVAEPLPGLEREGVAQTILAVQPFHHGLARPAAAVFPAHWVHFFMPPAGWGLAWSGAFLYASLLPRIRRIHAAHPVNLIHAHAALPCGHAAHLLNRELGIPFVVTVHGLDTYYKNQVGGIAGRWCERISRLVYRSAAQVICISEKVREQVLAGAAVRTAVVYNGVDPQEFSPGADNPASDFLLTVGNLIPIKGHELLLRAFAALPSRHSDIRCQIIGDGPERSRLTALAASLGIASRVQFLGRQSRRQVAEAMRGCLLFALPSRYEGLGCVYLEAMSSARAVIACRGQGIEEVIQQGVNGWLIEPENLAALTAALTALLDDPQLRRRMGESARSTILRGFTIVHQAAALAQLYNDCVCLPAS